MLIENFNFQLANINVSVILIECFTEMCYNRAIEHHNKDLKK